MKVHKEILGASLGMLLATMAVIPAANATLITSGEIHVSGPATGRGNFSFLIDGASVVGNFDEGSRLLLSGNEGSLFAGNHSVSGGAIDMFYGYVESQFVLWNKSGGAGPVPTFLTTTAPGAVLVQGQTVYHSPFSFEGSLCGSFVVNTPCDVTFPSLVGSGIAEFTFVESILGDGSHFFTPTGAKYSFSVPEPAPLGLFCVGLVALAFAKRKRPLH